MSFKTKILAGLTIALVAVAVVGVQVQDHLDQLSTFGDERKYQINLVSLTRLSNALANSENHVNNFLISHDSVYVNHFKFEKQNVFTLLDELHKSEPKIDDLKEDIVYRMYLLQRMIDLENKNPQHNILNEALLQLDSIDNSEFDISDKRLFSQISRHSEIAKNNYDNALDDKLQNITTKKAKDALVRIQRKNEEHQDFFEDAMKILYEEDMATAMRIDSGLAQIERYTSARQNHYLTSTSKVRENIISSTKSIGIGAFTIIGVLSIMVFGGLNKLHVNNAQLLREKDKAELLAGIKDRFLSNMSHEVRTPMNSIIGFTELLEKTHLEDNQRQYLSTIKNSSEHLMILINDMLDFEKLNSGKLKIENSKFELQKSFMKVANSLKEVIESKELAFQVEIDSNLGKSYYGAADRFEQIAHNLLSNACKFTSEGTVKITLKKESEGIMLQVMDTGVGMNELEQERIFDEFEQINHHKITNNGTGLGLAIVHKLVKLQNGTLEVESARGLGSTFSVYLPLTHAAEHGTENSYKKDKPNLEGIKILAVDDQEYNLELINIILTKWKADVQLARSGAEAINMVSNSHFDIILMDVQMPEIDGRDATRRLRQNEINTPIIALTASSSDEDINLCLDSGMNDVLLKPFKQDELKAKIKEYTSPKDPQSSESSDYSLIELHQVSEGNTSFIIDMLLLYIHNMKKDLNILRNLVADKDFDSISRQVHKMTPPNEHLNIYDMALYLKQLKNCNDEELDITMLKIESLSERVFEDLKIEIERLKQNDIRNAS